MSDRGCDEFRSHWTALRTGTLPEDPSSLSAHISVCRDCDEWVHAARVRERGHEPARYPCAHLADYATMTCQAHPDPEDCPDILIQYMPRFDEYRLPVRDGGSSGVVIRHCPWCGAETPQSKRERWFGELAGLGFDDPFHQDIPEAYRSDAWWADGDVDPNA